MRRATWGVVLVAALAALAVVAPAGAQNRYSFVDAAGSPLKFSKVTVKPQIACPEVRTLTTGSVSILAVDIVAAADGVPEHCRVTGSIAPTAKGIATRYYDRPVAFSYWDGCSTGGRQALISAQRFAGDFDGIVAGAPVLNFVDTTVAGLWNARAVADGPLTLDTMKLVA